jgi:hypothetical protein
MIVQLDKARQDFEPLFSILIALRLATDQRCGIGYKEAEGGF